MIDVAIIFLILLWCFLNSFSKWDYDSRFVISNDTACFKVGMKLESNTGEILQIIRVTAGGITVQKV